MKKLRIFRAISLGVAIVAALMLLSYAVWSTPWFGKKDPSFILGLWIALWLANAMAIHTQLKKDADPAGEQRAGSDRNSYVPFPLIIFRYSKRVYSTLARACLIRGDRQKMNTVLEAPKLWRAAVVAGLVSVSLAVSIFPIGMLLAPFSLVASVTSFA